MAATGDDIYLVAREREFYGEITADGSGTGYANFHGGLETIRSGAAIWLAVMASLEYRGRQSQQGMSSVLAAAAENTPRAAVPRCFGAVNSSSSIEPPLR